MNEATYDSGWRRDDEGNWTRLVKTLRVCLHALVLPAVRGEAYWEVHQTDQTDVGCGHAPTTSRAKRAASQAIRATLKGTDPP